MKKFVALVAILALTACALFAVEVKPFGIEFGKSLQSQNIAVDYGPYENAPGIYGNFVTPPKTHSQIDTYIVYTSDKYGVIGIVALDDIETTAYGTGIKDSFSRLRSGIAKSYGEETVARDNLNSSSIWKDADDWMYALKSGDRQLWSLWYVWTDEGLYEITLEAEATSSTKGDVRLVYKSPYFYTAAEEAQNVEDSVF